jgi:hypothetical protein
MDARVYLCLERVAAFHDDFGVHRPPQHARQKYKAALRQMILIRQ